MAHRLKRCVFKKKYTPPKVKKKIPLLRVAVCVIGKWEEQYLPEWVEHYKSIGFDNVLFYDNNDEGNNDQYEVLKPYIDDGFVIYHDWRKLHEHNQQVLAYRHTLKNYRCEYDWIAFFDCDEFLELLEYENIKEFLNSNDKFKIYDAIHFRWVDYTDNDLIYKDKRPLKERFTEVYNGSPVGANVKSIIKTTMCVYAKSVHNLNVRNCCDAQGNKISEGRHRIDNVLCENAFIKHYRFKSLEELCMKINRGSSVVKRDKRIYVIYQYLKENKYNYLKHIFLYQKGIVQKYLQDKIEEHFSNKNVTINLDNPISVTDKLNYLKIHDITELKSMCTDKILLHEYCKQKIGEDICVPILRVYNNVDEITVDDLPEQFILKCNHGYHMNILCTDKNGLNVEKCKLKIIKWLKRRFYAKSLQLHYSFIKPTCYVEKYLGGNVTDYKINCIHGEPQYIEVVIKRGAGKTQYTTYNLEWEKILPPTINGLKYNKKINVKKPLNLEKMIEYSKKLSEDFKFVRVDFYEVDGVLYLDQLTFTPRNCAIYSNGEMGNKIFEKLKVN